MQDGGNSGSTADLLNVEKKGEKGHGGHRHRSLTANGGRGGGDLGR